MYKALDIAKYVVAKCYNDWKPITNLKLQKILFYIQRSYLISDSCAFSDDIQAWMEIMGTDLIIFLTKLTQNLGQN